MTPAGKSGRPRPSEVASDTKRNFIPLVKAHYGDVFPPYSMLYQRPTEQLPLARRTLSTRPPIFHLEAGDPVTQALLHAAVDSDGSEMSGGSRVRVPFICAANEHRPGGDWETGCSGYEEKLCRRSNLSATLSSPWPDTHQSNYPIPSRGAILSDHVVVCRGPHDSYERLESWYDLPVISVPPTRWPKLKEGGSKYSFVQERDMIREKIRGALRICLFNGYDRVVIGDFGLGNGYRNPPQELAEIWREAFLLDPDLRGQFSYVVFVFEDPDQSTTRLILDEMARKESKRTVKVKVGGMGHKSGGGRSCKSSPPGSSSRCERGAGTAAPTDLAVFQYVFDPAEVQRVLSERDPRYTLDMITT